MKTDIASGQARIALDVRGNGQTLVFLHAGVADRRMWNAQVNKLSGAYRVVTYDRRGFGGTPPVAEPYRHTTDLLALLDAIDAPRATLIGCSQGGKIALDFTLAYPQRVDSLVLIAPAVGGAPAPESFTPQVEAVLQALDDAEASGDADRLNVVEARVWLDGVLADEGRVRGAPRDLFLEMNGAALRAAPLGEEQPAPPAWPLLGQVSTPTLVVYGDLDFPHAQARCTILADRLANATVHVMPGTAHLPSFEQPERFNALLTRFLDAGRPPAR